MRKNSIQPLRSKAYHQINRPVKKKKKEEKITQRPIYWLKYVFCL